MGEAESGINMLCVTNLLHKSQKYVINNNIEKARKNMLQITIRNMFLKKYVIHDIKGG